MLKVKQIAGALDAEISGVDLAKCVPASLAADIRKVFLDHQVICEPIESPFVKGLDGFAHPVVRTHPEAGRKDLYVNVAQTSDIKGISDEESAPLLRFLFEHQVEPEFTCRFAWELNAISFWDNRCVQHNPVNDYHGFRRLMQRITLKGDKPV